MEHDVHTQHEALEFTTMQSPLAGILVIVGVVCGWLLGSSGDITSLLNLPQLPSETRGALEAELKIRSEQLAECRLQLDAERASKATCATELDESKKTCDADAAAALQLAQNQSAQIDTLRWDLSLCQDAKTACDEAAGSGDEVTSKLGPSPSSSQNGSDSSSSDGNYCNCSCSSNNNNNSEGVNDNDDDADADSAHPAAWAVAERAVLADAAHWAQRGLLGNATLALEDGIMRQAHRSSSQSSAVLPLALGTLLLRRGLPHQALLACRSAAERAANVAVESEDSDDSKRNRRSDAFGGLAAARAELCIGRSLMLTTGSSKSRQRSATRPRAHNGSNSSGVGEESSGPLGAAAAFKRAVDLLRAHSGRAESPASLPTSVRLDPNLIVVGSPLRSNQHSAAVAEEADALADWGAALQSAGQGEPSIQALEAAMALIIDDAASQAASQAATLDANTSTSSSDKEALVMSGASLQRAARLAYNLGLARRAAGDFAGSVSVLEDAEQLSRMASTYQASDSDHYSDDDDGDSDDNEQAGHSGAENDMSVGELASPSAPCPAAVALALGAALADSHRLDAAISTTRRALGLTQSAASTASVSVTASRRGYSNEPSNEGNSNSSSELWAAPGAAAMAVLGSTWGGVNGDAAYGPRAGLNLGLLFLRQADDYAKLLHGDGKVRGRFIGGGTDVGGTAADAGSSAALFANQRTRALEAAATEFDAVLQTIDNAAAAALANVQASSAAAAARVSAFGPLAATPGAAPPLQLLLPPPALAAAVAGSATAHRLLGHEPLAYAMLARLLRLPPGLLPPRVRRKAGFDLGRALRQQDRFHEALEVLEAAAAVLRTRQPSGQLNSSEFGVDEDEAWAAAWAHAEDDDYGGGEGSSGDFSSTADEDEQDGTYLANDGGFVVSSSLWTVSEHDLWLELGLTRHVVSAPLREASASGGGAQADEPLTQPSHAGPRGAAVAYRRALSSRPNSVPALKLLAAALEDSAAGSGRSTSGGAESSAGTSSKRTPSQNERESPSAETEESLGARHARLRVVLGEEIPVVAPAASQAESVNATRIEGEPSFLQLGSSAQATPSTSSAAANTVDAAAEVDAAATASAAVATPVRDAASPADSPPTSPAMSADETPVPDPPLSTGETIAETEEEVSGDSKESTRESTKGETPQNETDHKEVKEAGEEDSEEDDEEEEAPLLDFEEPPALPLPTFPEDSAAAVKTASAYLKIGRAYATTGKWELALKEAIKAMLKAPSLAAPHALAAQALETTRHFAEAASAHLDAFARNASDWTGADAALRLVSAGTSASSGGGGVGGSGSALLPRADAQAVLQRLLGELRGGLLEFALPSTDSTTADNGAATPSDTAAAVGSGTRNEPLDRLSAARLALGQLLRADASEHRTKAQQYTQRADAYATAAAKARGTGTAAGKGSSGSGDNNEEEEEVMDLDAAPEVDLAQAAKLEAAETADRTAATEATTQADAVALEADSSLQRCSGNSSKLAMLCLDQRAKLAFEREEYKAAVKHWRSAARVASEKGQHSDAAVHYANIGAAKRELNYLKSAAAAYEQALMSAAAADTAPALGGGTSSSDVAGQIHFNLGVTKQQMGDTAGALASWDKAHEAGLRHPRLNQLRDDAQRNLTAVSGGDSSSSSRNSDGVTTDLGSGGERMSGKATEAVAEKPVQAEEVPNVKNNGYETRQAAAPAAAAAATHTAAGTSATPPAAVAAAAAVPTARAAPTTASEEAVGARQPPAGVRRQRYSHLFEDAEQQGESADSDASTARAAGATGGAAVAAGQKFGGNTSPRAAAAAGSANSGLESNNAAAEDEESSLESKLFAGLGDDDEDDEDGGGFGNGGGGGAGWSLSTAFQHAGQALSQVPKHFGAGVAAVRAWLDPEEAELEKLRALALAPVDVPNPHLARQQAGGGSGVGRGSDSAAAQRAQMAAAFAQQQRSAKAATTGAGGAGNAGGAAVGGGGGRAATPAGAVGDATSDATGELGMQELLEQLRQKRAAQISPQQQQQQAAAQRGAPAANTEEPQDLFAQFRQQQERQQLLQQQQQQQRQSASASSSSSQGNGATAARSAEDGVGGLQELLAQLQQQPQQPQQQQQAAAPQQAVQQQPQQQQQQPDEAEEGESEGLQALLQRLRDKKLAEHQQQQRQQQLEDQASGEDFAGEEEADPAAATAAGGMLATQNANTISSSSSSSSSLNQLLADSRAQQQQQRSEQEEEDENGEGDGGASGGGLSGIHGMLSGDEEVDEAHAYQAASNKGGSRG